MKIIKSLTAVDGPKEKSPIYIKTSMYDSKFKVKIKFASKQIIEQAVNIAKIYSKKNIEQEIPDLKFINILKKLSKCIDIEKEVLAETDALWTSRSWYELNYSSIPKAIETINWFCSNSKKVFKCQKEIFKVNGISFRNDPLGVIAVITPWNDPLVAFSWKVIPPLLAGNCVIWKPSEHCIESAHWIVKKMYELGLPKERLQLIVGDSETGKILVRTKIDGLGFTGSSKTAKLIASSTYKNKLIKLHIEAGGKGCAVLDANNLANKLEESIEDICEASFSNQGQICSAPAIIFIPENSLDIVIEHFKKYAISYAPGNPLDKERKIGGLISAGKRIQLKKILKKYKYIKLTESTDAKHGIDPSLIIYPDMRSEVVTKELFGPIVVVLPYVNLEEAINFINDQEYGLANGIYSNSKYAINKFSKKTRSGIIHINSWGLDPVGVPFGGIKNSGFGKEKCFETLMYFTNLKPICQL